MSPSEKKSTYLEFEDPDDTESNAHKKADGKKKTSFRIVVQPEVFLVAMIAEDAALTSDVLPAVRQLMNAAYLQGKRVGQELEQRKLGGVI